VGEALDVAVAQGHRLNEAFATLVQAQVLIRFDSRLEEVEPVLERLDGYARESGARAFLPLIQLERAMLAGLRGDAQREVRELHEAHRAFAELGAGGHAAYVEGVLAARAA
jgi:hypothetical protein